MEDNQASELSAYEEHLRAFLHGVAEKSGIPGVCLELSANGVRISVAIGALSNVAEALPMNSGARFEMGGISRVLLSLVVLELASHGKLSIDAPIAAYLPELAGTEVGDQVLLWHLLSHSGGYRSLSLTSPEAWKGFSWNKLTAFLQQTTLVFKPGSVFSHNPIGPALLAEIVKRLTSQSLLQIIKSRLCDPLNLTVGSRLDDVREPAINVKSHALDPNTRKLIPALQMTLPDFWLASIPDMTLSLADLIILLEAVMKSRDSEPTDVPFIDKEVAKLAQKQLLEIPFTTGGPMSEKSAINVGLGSAEYLPGWLGYNGPFKGQSTCFRYHSQQKIALAIGMNMHSPLLCEAIIQEVLRSLACEVSVPTSKMNQPALTPFEVAGTYVGCMGGIVNVIPQGQDIACELDIGLSGQKLSVLMGQNQHQCWVIKSLPAPSQLGFFRDPAQATPCLMVGTTAYRKTG